MRWQSTWRAAGKLGLALLVMTGAAAPGFAQTAPAAASALPHLLDQGWSPATRSMFYTTSQGSRIMPYAWFKALTQANTATPFAADALARYGYLPNDDKAANPEALPVGLVLDGVGANTAIGITCAACHTREISYRGVNYRIDGGPAKADFQGFLSDLAKAARATLASPVAFDGFAHRVLKGDYNAAGARDLRATVAAWTEGSGGLLGYASFMDRALPSQSWGPGRLDAFGMIFNRLSGLDLKLPGNVRVADAPVRYPFLWNATKQAKTQWNGAAPNGFDILGMVRNTGEVYGVFAEFSPHKGLIHIRPVVYNGKTNSANFVNLQKLEVAIKTLKPPTWPPEFGLKPQAVIDRGRDIYESTCSKGCHEKKDTSVPDIWETPILSIGTDARMYDNALATADPGVMLGEQQPLLLGPTLENPAHQTDILGTAVIGTLLQQLLDDAINPARWNSSGVWEAVRQDQRGLNVDAKTLAHDPAAIKGLIQQQAEKMKEGLSLALKAAPATNNAPAYEARVLEGIWAAGPYLHNGSVPNLWELLQPPAKRMKTFMVGSREFDPEKVGFAIDASPFNAAIDVSGACGGKDAGNSNCGHNYGTDLPDSDKWALIEYLKTLN